MTNKIELIVVGGGLAGYSAAIAAYMAGIETALVASRNAETDGRTTALFMPSINMIDELGVWQNIKNEAAALKTMRILDATDRLIRARPAIFHSAEIGLDTFGYNIPNQPMLDALENRAAELGLKIVNQNAVDFEQDENSARVILQTGEKLEASHIIAADGRRSIIREKVGIKHKIWDYGQKAIVLTFSHKLPHQNISTEFHTKDGPFTQVPLPGNRSSLVWATRHQEEMEYLEMPIDELNFITETKMHSILGSVEIDSSLQCFPLSSLIANKFGKGRVLLVGEAAHAFPPIGAQGLNLGLRDVKDAIKVLTGKDGQTDIATQYHRLRQRDIVTRTYGIDIFNQTLLTSFLPTQFIRSSGLSAASSIPPLRQFLMKQGASI